MEERPDGRGLIVISDNLRSRPKLYEQLQSKAYAHTLGPLPQRSADTLHSGSIARLRAAMIVIQFPPKHGSRALDAMKRSKPLV